MVDQSILDYIRENLAQGYSAEQIREFLLTQGIPSQDLETAFNELLQPYEHKPVSPPPVQQQPTDYHRPLPHQTQHIRSKDLMLIGLLVVVMAAIAVAVFYIWHTAEHAPPSEENNTDGEIEVITNTEFTLQVHPGNAAQFSPHALFALRA